MRAIFFRDLVRIRRGRESAENESVLAVVETACLPSDRAKELTPLLSEYFDTPDSRYTAEFSVLKG